MFTSQARRYQRQADIVADRTGVDAFRPPPRLVPEAELFAQVGYKPEEVVKCRPQDKA